MKLYTANHTEFCVDDEPFGNGAEGNVHHVQSPRPWRSAFCVKLYHPKYRTPQYEQKLSYMIQNCPKPPQNYPVRDPNGIYLICWPHDLVYDARRSFAGFLMPKAPSDSISLYHLCLPTISPRVQDAWYKLDRSTDVGMRKRAQFCRRLAVPIHIVHHLGTCVFADMKPQNILVNPRGTVSLIDLDSIQINSATVAHHMRAVTPEYMPPEMSVLNPRKNMVPVSWDLFSLAVIFYEILFGLHPFTASCNQDCQSASYCARIDEKIQCGLSHIGKNASHIEKGMLPPPHRNFRKTIPKSLQELFERTFREGHEHPHLRPSAAEWGQTIYGEIQNSPRKFRACKMNVDSGNQLIESISNFIPWKKITTLFAKQRKN